MIRPNDVEGEALKSNRRALDVLVAFGIRNVVPLHLAVARQLAADPVALHHLRGMRLDEFLLDLMGFERVRLLLTRRFLKSYCNCAQQNEEALWWASMHLNRALQTSSLEVRRVDSVKQLLRDGVRAKRVLRLAGISPVPKS